MRINLDMKDRRLLFWLSQDCRMPHTQLAKKVGLSKTAISYRIDRLVKSRVISQFTCAINTGAIGLDTFTLLLRFTKNIYAHAEFIKFFKEHTFANWAITLSGQWDIFVEFAATDLRHVQTIIDGVLKEFSGSLVEYKVLVLRQTLRVEHLIKDLYKDTAIKPPAPVPRKKTDYVIDEVDGQILFLLSKNSSQHYLDLARQLDLSIDIVRNRMKRLTNEGILIKSFAEINYRTLGYVEYLFTLQLKNLSDEKLKRLRSFIANHDSVTYAFLDTIRFSIAFVVWVTKANEIDDLSRHIREKYNEVIDTQEYFIIREQLVFTLFPKGIVNIKVHK